MKQDIIYIWEAITTQGKKLSGEIHAKNQQQALEQLKNQPMHFINIHKKRISHLPSFSKNIRAFTITLFFRQLASLISSGIPIVQSLQILSNHFDNVKLNEILLAIKMDLENGISFGTSLQKFPNNFDKLSCQLIQIGEQTGTLTHMLLRIAEFKENHLQFKRKIFQSLFYPMILLLVSCIVTLIMLIFVIPRFADLFQSMHTSLPKLTLFVICLSEFFQHTCCFFILPIAIILLFINKIKKSAKINYLIDIICFKLPVINQLLKKIFLAQFSNTLAIAYQAGIPMIQAIKLIADTSANHLYKWILLSLHSEIASGLQLYKCMQKNSIFPTMMIQMVKIGEESGSTDQLLKKIGEIYESEIAHLINIFSQILEPLIMIILGVLIGGLVIAMYLPIFKLGNLM